MPTLSTCCSTRILFLTKNCIFYCNNLFFCSVEVFMPLVFFLCSQFVLLQLAVKSNFVSKLPFSLFEVSCKTPFNAIYQILLKGRVFSMMCRLVLSWYQTKVLGSLCILYWANYENRRRKWNLGSLLFASVTIDNCVSITVFR